MLDVIRKFLKGSEESVGGIKDDIALAAGIILLEIAYSDNEFTEDEQKFIVDVLKRDFNLSQEETDELLVMGKQILEEDTNRWRYIDKINEKYSNEDKLRLIHMVWELIYADDKLDKYEDHLIHRLSKVLHIPHNELIQEKVKVINNKKECKE